MSQKHQRLTCQSLQELSDRVHPRSAMEKCASKFYETAELADKWEAHGRAFESLFTTFMSWLVTVKGMNPMRADYTWIPRNNDGLARQSPRSIDRAQDLCIAEYYVDPGVRLDRQQRWQKVREHVLPHAREDG